MAGLAELILNQAGGRITGEIKSAISDEISGLGYSDIQKDIITHSVENNLVNTATGSFVIGLIPHVGGIIADRVAAEINHIGGIQDLADNDFPGFETEMFELPSGEMVNIYIDATPYLKGDAPKAYVVDPSSSTYAYVRQSELSREDQEALKERINEIGHGAKTDIYNHNPQHDAGAYKDDLRSQLESTSHAGLDSDIDGDYDLASFGNDASAAGDIPLLQEAAEAGVSIAESIILASSGPDVPGLAPQTFTV